ncbi:2-succinyl-5-enolpyruvyl-6-hydroxy-3-cyclohexene-1-carboxylic-acid synthase [Flavobacteriaceae bacterium TP-CH-4]|uniref:2-succinyl-5-enolpyruvyl-6-hydroxy-3-cyclohexene-1-carboxylate synthase n=1 Tax=Pelagihabitans pacificus TaxID=2696054 RepID=A0A967E5A5_9FLAO|nr:2-succinyl-5-enolpyruvyl-6-hydroxy-3-cyclohexene-1-carboxylic-acid synthase [Pelagihabitans pacificus]NHF59237.1 2-succinyl-5-enolpyruvyl-6-hydroxy-3-cyclohexene-1-carboxylic-acid synthase [Pelagihabitans pacificus]
MKYPSIPAAQALVQHCKAKGIKNIVISPGSRNAPLIIGFSEDPYFSCFSIVDERCAAFFALGIAQQLREPVVVTCTSGSALLNYYAAVAEAFYSQIPLVVISADRPRYKIDVGDGQTIRQDNVFHRHIGYSTHLRQDVVHATDSILRYVPHWLEKGSPEEIQESVQTFNDTELNKALNTAIESQLPVHVNIPFEEPLYEKHTQQTVTALIKKALSTEEYSVEEIYHFADIWNSTAKKMVLVGVNYPDTVSQHYLDHLASDPSIIVLTETTSNLHHANFFPSIDSLIAPIEKLENREEWFKRLQPEILLTFGGLVVSKKIKAFLRRYQPLHHWHVDSLKAFDTFFCLSHHFKSGANTFLGKFLPLVQGVQSDYFSYWNNIKKSYEIKRKAYLGQIPFSDMLGFAISLQAIPKGYRLQLANSSTVRYAQLFDLDPSLRVFCNRGTSGIDGSTSTAIGAAVYGNAPTLLITGDLSFFYDSNGLWNNYVRPDFRIVLFNNQGGGIFRILPGRENTDNFETYFETAHDLNASQLCQMFGFEYASADDALGLENVFASFYEKSRHPKLLEISTPRLLNNKILLDYFDFISSVFINR